MKKFNLALAADSYKGEHWAWMNQGVAFATGYLEPRIKNSYVQVAGMSKLAHQVAGTPITEEDVEELLEFSDRHSYGTATINEAGFRRIIEEFGGYIPVEIKALEDGIVIPTQIPVMQVRNSVAGFAWVVPYFELLWLHCWKTMDVATNSFTQKLVLTKYGKDTMPEAMFDSWIPYALHDFGARSVGTMEEAEVGLGHLYNFDGSDNWLATRLTNQVHSSDMSSHSVLALEHNVVLSHGEEAEHDLFEEFSEYVLTEGRIGSMLIDTYDLDAAVQWVIDNKDRLEAWAEEGVNGRLVLRPDSGHPTDMPISILNRLLDAFEADVTEHNGYRILPPWIGVIQGDGNNTEVLEATCKKLRANNISLANIVFGEGGELINNYKRDDKAWAFKLSQLTMYDGTEVGCAKKPKHSPEKHSKEGYFSYVDGNLYKADSWEEVQGYKVLLRVKEGTYLSYLSLDVVRDNANKAVKQWNIT